MPPFEPIYRDGKSAATLIVELAADKPYDHVVTFENIADQLGIDPGDAVRIRSGIARAKPLLEQEHQRALEAVPRKGYRIVRPGEHARLATGHRRKSDRAIKRAIRIVRNANENDMTDSERDRNRKVGMALSLLHERQEDADRRISRLEDLLLGKHKPTIIPGIIVQPRAIGGPGPGSTEDADKDQP